MRDSSWRGGSGSVRWRPHSSPRWLRRRPHPGGEALARGCVVAPVPQNGLVHDVEPFRGDKAGDGLLTARVRFEGDENRRFLSRSNGSTGYTGAQHPEPDSLRA
jgi:hypothetical protein